MQADEPGGVERKGNIGGRDTYVPLSSTEEEQIDGPLVPGSDETLAQSIRLCCSFPRVSLHGVLSGDSILRFW